MAAELLPVGAANATEGEQNAMVSAEGGMLLQVPTGTGGRPVELETLVAFMDCLDVVHAYPKFEQTLLKIVRDYTDSYL